MPPGCAWLLAPNRRADSWSTNICTCSIGSGAFAAASRPRTGELLRQGVMHCALPCSGGSKGPAKLMSMLTGAADWGPKLPKLDRGIRLHPRGMRARPLDHKSVDCVATSACGAQQVPRTCPHQKHVDCQPALGVRRRRLIGRKGIVRVFASSFR